MNWLKKLGKIVAVLLAVLIVGVAAYLVYASATANRRLAFPQTPYPALTASTDPEVIARGRYLVYGPAHCAECHGGDDREHPERIVPGMPLTGGLEFGMGPIGITYSANLTPDPETGIGRRSDKEIARVLRTGILADGSLSFFMRFSVSTLSDDDLVAVLSYLRSQPPVRRAVPQGHWGLLGKAMLPMMPIAPRLSPAPKGVPPGAGPTVERGEYLANQVALCTMCHSAFDMRTFETTGPRAAGGDPDPSHGKDSDMEFASPNLTSDPETGYTGKADEATFVTRIKSGRAIASSIMPWETFTQMTEDDLRSVYRYLRSLPPIKHDNGPTYRKAGWTKPAPR